MSTEIRTDPSPPTALEKIVRRATSLYSLPAVAAEVIELTNNPKVDARALKDCIEVDPALTAKLLRVVNSSLFGLSREVSDLNQAIALLGTKPLKLLVLGFSLPEELFCRVARQQLEWYWTTTLARAVAAREISEALWQRPGDDAFLAGLLQDIGILVLLGELREPYAQCVDRVIEHGVDLQGLEIGSMGFDHTDLSAALLDHWKMPKLLVASISERREYQRLQRLQTPEGELARVLHLAGLLAELIAQKRLNVLPELLEAGDAYCGLDKQRLTELVADLQPKVQQLADVLSLDLCETADYTAVLIEAHTQMSIIVESVAEPLSRIPGSSEQAYDEILADTMELRKAVDNFLHRPAQPAAIESSKESAEVELQLEAQEPESTLTAEIVATELRDAKLGSTFADRLTFAVGQCRSRRQPLSVLLLELGCGRGSDVGAEGHLAEVLDMACHALDLSNAIVEAETPCRRVMLLPGCDRQEAVRHANAIFRSINAALDRLDATDGSQDYSIGAGVAAVSLPVKNFPPRDLMSTAERCLDAAKLTGSCVVKSLEIY